jgi:hypothetical protein
MGEIEALMAQAYPGLAARGRLRSGLATVADALNAGDVSKAMIAALHLRLPELDRDGAARIGQADDALSKYDPSEPRDSRGRWTTGGGAEPSAAAPGPGAGVQAKNPAPRHASREAKPKPSRTRPAASGVISNVSDIAIPNSPATAPARLRFAPALQKEFDALWAGSFSGGRAREQGADIVAREDGTLEIQNVGGLRSDSDSFKPNLGLNDPVDYGLVGLFHTHPYNEWYTAISLSGADAGELINTSANFVVAQSGDAQFLFLKTRACASHADPALLFNQQNARMAQLEASGMPFSKASSVAARETAQRLGLAYYEGAHGVLRRVYP